MPFVAFKDATLPGCTGNEPRCPATVAVEDNVIREIEGSLRR